MEKEKEDMGKCGCLFLGLERQGRKEAAAAGRGGGRRGSQVEAATGSTQGA